MRVRPSYKFSAAALFPRSELAPRFSAQALFPPIVYLASRLRIAAVHNETWFIAFLSSLKRAPLRVRAHQTRKNIQRWNAARAGSFRFIIARSTRLGRGDSAGRIKFNKSENMLLLSRNDRLHNSWRRVYIYIPATFTHSALVPYWSRYRPLSAIRNYIN